MCFSFGASVSAFVAAALAISVTLGVVVHKRYNDSAFEFYDFVSALLLLAFAFAVACMQLVDAAAHANHANHANHERYEPLVKEWKVGVAGYLFTGLQPACVAAIAAYLLQQAVGLMIICIGMAVLSAVHVVVCIALDDPLDSWLRVTVDPITTYAWLGKVCAVTYNFYVPRPEYKHTRVLYGSDARYWVYVLVLSAGIGLVGYAALERLGTDVGSDAAYAYAQRSGIAWLCFFGVAVAGVFVALAIEQKRGHFGSVWCLVSNSATVVACAVLQTAVGDEVAAWSTVGVVVAWVAVFAIVTRASWRQ